MNKLLCFVAFALSVVPSVLGYSPQPLWYATVGGHCYKDGQNVLVGERYALVWVKDWDKEGVGDYFEGFNADATLVNQNLEENILLDIKPTRYEGRCSEQLATLTTAHQELIRGKSGEFRVYLLDTRTLDKTGVLVGENENVVPSVNEYLVVDREKASDVLGGGGDMIGLVPAKSSDFAVSYVPENTPRPLITSCKVEEKDGKRVLVMKVKKTVPYLAYNVSTGTDPSTVQTGHVAEAPQYGGGTQEETITLTVPVDDTSKNRFYKVIRH